MKEHKPRVDTQGPALSLTSNPFSRLGEVPAERFAAVPEPVPEPETPGLGKEGHGFRVARTKKGGYPINLEKRPAGKVATIVRNVSGDTSALLSLLKKRCAAGGKAYEDAVEIQGDHCARVEAILRELRV